MATPTHANELAATVVEAARRFGDRPAVVGPTGVTLSYLDLERLSGEVATWLAAEAGLRPGNLLALCLPASVDHLVVALGAARAGVAYAGVNPRQTDVERATALDVLAPDLVVGTADLAPRPSTWPTHLVEVAEVAPDVARGVRGAEVGPDAVVSDVEADEDRAVAVVLTSGTTGVPKAAVFTDRQVRAIRRLDVGDTWGGGGALLVSTELCHVGIATKLNWYLRLGCTLHVLARWRAADALDVIERERIASVGGISSQFALLLRQPDFDRRDLSHVQVLIAAGGPSSPGLVAEARERFGAAYTIRYSSTESGGIGCATAVDAPDEEVLHTVGRPRDGVEVRVGDDGRVWLRSRAVMSHYHRAPELTARTIVDGWLRTSDLGELDELGRLRLLGRESDSWVRGGHNVFPQPVEAVLSSHPLVAEVAVVPRADDVMGHVGVAVVVPRDAANPPTLDALREHARDHLASWQLPEALDLHLDPLPRTAVDKIDRRALRP